MAVSGVKVGNTKLFWKYQTNSDDKLSTQSDS